MKKLIYVVLISSVLNSSIALAQDTPKQPMTAVNQIGIWLIGFHPMKDNPSMQFIAHHFCQQLRDDLMQCALYDGNQPNSRLIGIEYIIPQQTYQNLPEEEQSYWHPHNFEIFAGQLVAPGIPDDMQLLAGKINSYGKTWHTWNAGIYGEDAEPFPLGEPGLAWSFNHLGEAKEGLIEEAFKPFGISMQEKRQQRQEYLEQAEPQCGMKALARHVDKFEGPVEPLPGIESREGC